MDVNFATMKTNWGGDIMTTETEENENISLDLIDQSTFFNTVVNWLFLR